MNWICKTVSMITILALFTTAIPLWAAKERLPYEVQTTSWDKDYEGNEIEGYDGQAYFASRYVPALRPYTVVGGLLLIGLLTVILQNTPHHRKHPSSH